MATTFAYDADNRVLQTQQSFAGSIPGGALVQQTYTADGLCAALTDAGNNTTSFAYDGFDRLITTTYPDRTTETYTYDADANALTRKTRASSSTTFTYAYDTLNRLTAKTPATGPVVSYSYDLTGRLTGVSDTSSAIQAIAAPTTTTSYTTSYTYDALNRRQGVSFGDVPAATTSPASITPVAFTHSYNAVNQRTGQSVSDNSWLGYPGSASSTSYTANTLNQYTAVGSASPTYDANGNLTFDGTYSFGYDLDNRLTSASGGGNTASYAFDGRGRRKVRSVTGTTTIAITDADNREVLEYDGSTGAILRWYAYGLGPTDLVSQMNLGGTTTRSSFIPDMLGSIIGSQDAVTGTITSFGYRAYGNSPSPPSQFGYTGQRIDTETSLYYYRARHYSPVLGRFLQSDPVNYQSGMHLYAYVGNDPVNVVDVFGLAPSESGWGSSLASAAHLTLGVASFCPSICGSAASLVDAGLYVVQGDWLGAGISAGAAVGGLITDAGAIKLAAIGGVAALDATKAAREVSQAGEVAANIVKNTERIESVTGAAYRVPDVLNREAQIIGEAKNVGSLSYTRQLQDFVAYADRNDYQFTLWVRPESKLTGPLQSVIGQGRITPKFLP